MTDSWKCNLDAKGFPGRLFSGSYTGKKQKIKKFAEHLVFICIVSLTCVNIATGMPEIPLCKMNSRLQGTRRLLCMTDHQQMASHKPHSKCLYGLMGGILYY